MIRSFRFTDDAGRELTVSEREDYDGVEIRVGGLPVELPAHRFLELARLLSSALSRYGEHPLLVDLGSNCGDCEGTGEVQADHGEGAVVERCVVCEGRGFLPGEPEKRPKKTSVIREEGDRAF